MPAYNFKQQFAEAVEEGTKRQTIRPKRKRPTKPGDRLYLYTGMRTKQCRKLGEATCTEVLDIEIQTSRVTVAGEALSWAQMKLLASLDGFSDQEAFFQFFEDAYGLPFQGELIRWEKEATQHDF